MLIIDISLEFIPVAIAVIILSFDSRVLACIGFKKGIEFIKLI